MNRLQFIVMLVGAICMIAPLPITAQSAPCGVVNAIETPFDISDTLRRDFDDFARFRQRWGGNHTGIDLGFNRHLEAVGAAARGQVTYADPEGWDTELGVVILRHIFPDGSVFYSLYGHMEETDAIRFPAVGSCVELGEIVGVIGDPLQSLPHLHFEIRDFLPNDGGPGYVSYNPRRDGWYQPLDFVALWQARLQGGVVSALTFVDAPTLPPITLTGGGTVIASGKTVAQVDARGQPVWSVTASGDVISLGALSDDRVVVYTDTGQVFTLRAGRYLAVWQVEGLDSPFALIGDVIVFLIDADSRLTAYNADGQPLWSTPATDGSPRYFASNGHEIGLLTGSGAGSTLWQIGADGASVGVTLFERTPVITPVNGGWIALAGRQIMRISGGESVDVGTLPVSAGRQARVSMDILGGLYIFADDPQNTLLSIDTNGVLRWQTELWAAGNALLAVDNGCVLYALDSGGLLNIVSATDGARLGQRQLYPGGEGTGYPAARVLRIDSAGMVQAAAGSYSLLTFDNAAVSNGALASCLLG